MASWSDFFGLPWNFCPGWWFYVKCWKQFSSFKRSFWSGIWHRDTPVPRLAELQELKANGQWRTAFPLDSGSLVLKPFRSLHRPLTGLLLAVTAGLDRSLLWCPLRFLTSSFGWSDAGLPLALGRSCGTMFAKCIFGKFQVVAHLLSKIFGLFRCYLSGIVLLWARSPTSLWCNSGSFRPFRWLVMVLCKGNQSPRRWLQYYQLSSQAQRLLPWIIGSVSTCCNPSWCSHSWNFIIGPPLLSLLAQIWTGQERWLELGHLCDAKSSFVDSSMLQGDPLSPLGLILVMADAVQEVQQSAGISQSVYLDTDHDKSICLAQNGFQRHAFERAGFRSDQIRSQIRILGVDFISDRSDQVGLAAKERFDSALRVATRLATVPLPTEVRRALYRTRVVPKVAWGW